MNQFSESSIKNEPDVCASRHGGAETSVAANKKVQKETDRLLIYNYIVASKHYGHTLDELSILLHRQPNSISGRLTELSYQRKIIYSGRKRRTRSGCLARVYVTLNY